MMTLYLCPFVLVEFHDFHRKTSGIKVLDTSFFSSFKQLSPSPEFQYALPQRDQEHPSMHRLVTLLEWQSPDPCG